MPPDSLVWIDEEVAFITVQSFSDANYNQTLTDLLFEQAARAKVLVIDLRGNGGGNAVNVEHLAGKVLPPNTVLGTFVEKADVEKFARKNPGKKATLDELALQAVMIQRAFQGKTKNFGGDLIVVTDRSMRAARSFSRLPCRNKNAAKLLARKREEKFCSAKM